MRKQLAAVLFMLCLCLAVQPALAVFGAVLETDAFQSLEEGFRMETFDGEMHTVKLSETQLFLFDGKPVDCLLPNLWITLLDSPGFEEDAAALAEILGSIISVAQTLQESFPDVFVFNTALAETYEETGLRYAVASPKLWLWAETMGAVAGAANGGWRNRFRFSEACRADAVEGICVAFYRNDYVNRPYSCATLKSRPILCHTTLFFIYGVFQIKQ